MARCNEEPGSLASDVLVLAQREADAVKASGCRALTKKLVRIGSAKFKRLLFDRLIQDAKDDFILSEALLARLGRAWLVVLVVFERGDGDLGN